jgi:hypothetical protein
MLSWLAGTQAAKLDKEQVMASSSQPFAGGEIATRTSPTHDDSFHHPIRIISLLSDHHVALRITRHWISSHSLLDWYIPLAGIATCGS